MSTAKELADKYVRKLSGHDNVPRFLEEIRQYALRTVCEHRRIIKAKKTPPDIIEYLPFADLDYASSEATSKSAWDVAERYIDLALGWHAVEDLELEIQQYARQAVLRDRMTIKANNVPSRLVEYLPLPDLD
jgi:hypothetical protein